LPAWRVAPTGRRQLLVRTPSRSRPKNLNKMGGLMERALCPVLVGRERELSLLEDALLAAHRGNGQVMVVGGDAGVGKPRLAAELQERARRAGGWSGYARTPIGWMRRVASYASTWPGGSGADSGSCWLSPIAATGSIAAIRASPSSRGGSAPARPSRSNSSRCRRVASPEW